VIAYIANKEGLSVDEVVNILNKKSGLLGIGKYSDMRTIHERAVQGDEQCRLGLEMFAYRVCEYIGAYAGVLDSVDALVFTGGIGEGAYYLRTLICEHLNNLGIRLDAEKNRKGSTVISKPSSKTKVLVIPTNEELMIARETCRVVRSTAR
jgi:acetate kinase